MKIGEISERSGLSRDTIRYYEKLGLLVIDGRHRDNNYKHYGLQALERLAQIQQLKMLGFTLNEIRQLLCDNVDSSPCEDLPTKLQRKIERIDEQIATLQRFKISLTDIQRACNGHCGTLKGVPTCMPSAAQTKSCS